MNLIKKINNEIDLNSLDLLRETIKEDHNGDVKAYLEGYVCEVMYSHGYTAQELVYVSNLAKYFDAEANHFIWKLVTDLIDKRGINNENDLYS